MAGKYKELEICKHDNKSLYYLKFKGGGELPNKLKTDFTDVSTAQRFMDEYYRGNMHKAKAAE